MSEFGQSWYIGTHPDLAVTNVIEKEKQLICLGPIVDTENPDQDNEMVLKRLVNAACTFEELEKLLSPCGGRWLIFSRLRGEQRIYPDAGGTRSVFYTAHDNPQGGLWVASQPGLMSDLLGINPMEEVVREFTNANHDNSWPGEVTPYPGVRQLLPNHYLDMSVHRSRRFWPTSQPDPLEVNKAAAGIHQILNGLIRGVVRRGQTAIPLTGGHDSRAVFAAAGELREAVTFFLIKDLNTRYHDILLPKRVARTFSTAMRVINAKPCPPSFWTSLRRNVADMLWEPGEIKMFTFGWNFPDWFVVTGSVAETGQCFYYKDGTISEPITPQFLAKVSGYSGNAIAIQAFISWLADMPSQSFVNPLDLFYIEHRGGNWLSMANNCFDMVCEVVPAYNCRKYFETVLGVDVAFRRKPYELFRLVCEAGAPHSSDIPFNVSTLDSVSDWFKSWVPWRVQLRYQSWRRQRAGFEYSDSIS